MKHERFPDVLKRTPKELKTLSIGTEVEIIDFDGKTKKIPITPELVRQADIAKGYMTKGRHDAASSIFNTAIGIYLYRGIEDLPAGQPLKNKAKYCANSLHNKSYPWVVDGHRTWTHVAPALGMSIRELRYYTHLGKALVRGLKIDPDDPKVPEIPESLKGIGFFKLCQLSRFANIFESLIRQGYAKFPSGRTIELSAIQEMKSPEFKNLIALIAPKPSSSGGATRSTKSPEDAFAESPGLDLLNEEINQDDPKYKDKPWLYARDLAFAMAGKSAKEDTEGEGYWEKEYKKIIADCDDMMPGPEKLKTMDPKVVEGASFLMVLFSQMGKKLNGVLRLLLTTMRHCPAEYMGAVGQFFQLREKMAEVNRQTRMLLYMVSDLQEGNKDIFDLTKIESDYSDVSLGMIRELFIDSFSEAINKHAHSLKNSKT